ARPLRELFPPLLVALHLLDDREYGRGQLEDDARRDVRHDAEREHGGAAEAPAREQVVQAEQRALTLVPQEVGEGLHVHAGGRDVRPHAVHDQAEEREEDFLLQLRDLEQVGQSRCGHRGGQLAMVPPACSIFERAEADTVTPFTLNLRCTSPMPSSLMGWSGRRTSPAPNSVSGVTSAPSASCPRCRTFTTCAGCLNGFVKPRFGIRRMRGIWPPSNPGRTLPPWRAVCPLPPRPAVLPIPEPGPRPLRMRARCDPGGLWRLDRVMCRSSGFAAFARGFAFGLALVFALAFGFAIAYSPTFALPVTPRPGGAPDTACPGATDDPASPPLPGGASSPALRASAARTRAARFPNGPAGSAARLCRAAAAADRAPVCACGISEWAAA